MKRCFWAIIALIVFAAIISACSGNGNTRSEINSASQQNIKNKTNQTSDTVSTSETIADESTKEIPTDNKRPDSNGVVDADDIFDYPATKQEQTGTTRANQNGLSTGVNSTSVKNGATSSNTEKILDKDGDGWIDNWYHP